MRYRDESQYTYRCVVLPDIGRFAFIPDRDVSQCTYRCVVLPDLTSCFFSISPSAVSMHLQVRGAP